MAVTREGLESIIEDVGKKYGYWNEPAPVRTYDDELSKELERRAKQFYMIRVKTGE